MEVQSQTSVTFAICPHSFPTLSVTLWYLMPVSSETWQRSCFTVVKTLEAVDQDKQGMRGIGFGQLVTASEAICNHWTTRDQYLQSEASTHREEAASPICTGLLRILPWRCQSFQAASNLLSPANGEAPLTPGSRPLPSQTGRTRSSDRTAWNRPVFLKFGPSSQTCINDFTHMKNNFTQHGCIFIFWPDCDFLTIPNSTFSRFSDFSLRQWLYCTSISIIWREHENSFWTPGWENVMRRKWTYSWSLGLRYPCWKVRQGTFNRSWR